MMARYGNPGLRDRLASEYVLGTLRGGARARFESLLRYDPLLRQLVTEWEARLTPMAAAAAEITPPARLWRRIAARINARTEAAGWWKSLVFWRTCTASVAAALIAFGAYVGHLPTPEPPVAMVAVMLDDTARPAVVLSWPQLRGSRDPHVRVHVIEGRHAMAPDTSWQLWVLPTAKSQPIPLGLLSADKLQTISLEPSQIKTVWQSWGIALSVEPKGGSPTGAPTGPVLFRGQCVRVM